MPTNKPLTPSQAALPSLLLRAFTPVPLFPALHRSVLVSLPSVPSPLVCLSSRSPRCMLLFASLFPAHYVSLPTPLRFLKTKPSSLHTRFSNLTTPCNPRLPVLYILLHTLLAALLLTIIPIPSPRPPCLCACRRRKKRKRPSPLTLTRRMRHEACSRRHAERNDDEV